MNYSYSGNQYTNKTNYIDKANASDINDLQNEVEIIEGVLTNGTTGHVLTADNNGKATWAEISVDGEDIKSTEIVNNMVVSGDSTYGVNGTYILQEELMEGRPYYIKGEVVIRTYEDGDLLWVIYGLDGGYYSFEEVATPDLVLEWFDGDTEEIVPSINVEPVESQQDIASGKALSTDGAGKATWTEIPEPAWLNFTMDSDLIYNNAEPVAQAFAAQHSDKIISRVDYSMKIFAIGYVLNSSGERIDAFTIEMTFDAGKSVKGWAFRDMHGFTDTWPVSRDGPVSLSLMPVDFRWIYEEVPG